MAGIRINSGAKRIEVNDNGDYITLNLSDNNFLDRFFSLYKNLQEMADKATEEEKEIKKKHAGGGDSVAFAEDAFSLYKGFSSGLMAEVDNLFGEGTCTKVFGDIKPTFDLYIEFFEQLTPYIQEFAKEKAQRMNKYSAARTGNV